MAEENKRNKWRILEVLSAQEPPLNLTKIALKAGVSTSLVSQVLRGEKNSERVFNVLRLVGVPEYLICDPKNCEAM